MKPEIPETGVVIITENNTAKVLLKGGEHCKNCGAGKIRLCRPTGDTALLSVANTIGAGAGDTVKVGLERSTQAKGLILAYVVPLVSFLAGTICGHFISEKIPIPAIEVITGFVAFLLGSWYSLKKLRHMNNTCSIAIQAIIQGKGTLEETRSEEERRYDLVSG